MTPQDFTPQTYLPEVAGALVPQRKIFDPAVMQYADGFRLGSPTITDTSLLQLWLAAKRKVGSEVIRQLAHSTIGESVMLRGSWLLALWYDSRAREPHDLDYVALGASEPDHLLQAMVDAVARSTELSNLGVRPHEITTTSIWTYDRVEGRRLAVPWAQPNGLVGVLQIDITFDEPLDEQPETLQLADDTTVLTASASQSLIWKLEWLLSDMYPQGKDLYDAVLLHEASPLTAAQWSRAVTRVLEGEWHRPTPPTAEDLHVPDTEWSWFCEEYPDLSDQISLPVLRQQLVDAINAVT